MDKGWTLREIAKQVDASTKTVMKVKSTALKLQMIWLIILLKISKVYVLLNKVLNTLVRRKFGKQFSIRLNSLRFVSNRINVNHPHTCSERITLKSVKPVSMNELMSIKDFILFNINSALLCIDSKGYIEVTDVEIIIM